MTLGSLVGRHDEIRRLRESVVGVTTGRGRSIWVEGEPGIGKSALLTAGLAEAHQVGCQVYRDSADEARLGFPLWVLLDCLRVGPRSADPARAGIAALLRAESTSTAMTPADVVAAVAERVLVLVDQLCKSSPMVLVVDDLQWADEASLELWRRLHLGTAQLPLLLVGACRPVPRRMEVAALRASLVADGADVIGLGPLTDGQAVELVERLVGATPGSRLRQHVRQAGGNPLYLRELVDTLIREEGVHVAAGVAESTEQAGVPASLAAAIADRLDFLSQATAGVLQLAALLDAECSIADLRLVSGQDNTELRAALAEAVAAGVLAPSVDRFVFRHGLIRQALYERIPAAFRPALHRQAAEALAGAGAPVERIAEHLLAAAPTVSDAWMVEWVAGAASALVYRAPQTAIELLRPTREMVDVEDPRRDSLDLSLATALFLASRYQEAIQLGRPMLEYARDPALAGRMAWTVGYTLLLLDRADEALALTREALRKDALSPAWTARLQAMQAVALHSSGRLTEADAAARRAKAAGEQAGDPVAVGYALHVQSLLLDEVKHDDEASLAAKEQALAVIGEEPETIDLRLLLLRNRTLNLQGLGRMAEADRATSQALVLTEQAGTPLRLAWMRLRAAYQWFFTGRWDDALAEWEAATEPLRSRPEWLELCGLGALIACHRDDRAASAGYVRAADGFEPGTGWKHTLAYYLGVAQALMAERDGQPEQALALLVSALNPMSIHDDSRKAPFHYLWFPDVVRLALTVDDRPTAVDAAETCAVDAGPAPVPPRRAAIDHCRGLIDADPAALSRAADAYHTSGLPLYRAQALENLAVLLAERGDTEAARAAHATALDVYTGLNAAWDILRANTRLRRLGIRRGPRGPRRRPASGWEALTPAERKIADMVATGRSNPEIAAELFLSRRTVQSHVSNILAKLGARSRFDIARLRGSR